MPSMPARTQSRRRNSPSPRGRGGRSIVPGSAASLSNTSDETGCTTSSSQTKWTGCSSNGKPIDGRTIAGKMSGAWKPRR